jgi:hypothetical protein
MKLTRKEFIQLAVASAGAAALGACGDDTSGTGGGGTGGGGTGGSGSTTSSTTGSTTTSSTTTTTTTTGAGGAGGEGGGTANLTCSSNIGTNHGHSLEVPAADVADGVEKTYNIQGTSQHPHMVTITAADFTTLAGGGTVQKTSTNDNGHTHSVTVTCVV